MPAERPPDGRRLPAQVERAVEAYLGRIAAGHSPDLEHTLESLEPEHRTLFRVEAFAAEVLWFLEEGDEVRVIDVYARCADDDERSRVRRAVEGARAAFASAAAGLAVGDRIDGGRYELKGELGRGGIGVVFEAYDHQLERTVAIKAVRVDPGRDVDALTENLIAESVTLASLQNDNVVTVHDAVHEGDRVCVVLERVLGCDLEEVVTRISAVASAAPAVRLAALRGVVKAEDVTDGPLGEKSWYRVVARLVSRLASGLEAAHGAGVLHRDIKPQNVVLRETGEPVLLDFGLAHRLGTQEGERFQGTPEYLAPEQVDTLSIGQDRRTDVYALGLVLYELLALRRAFPRGADEKLEDLFARIRHRRFDSLQSVDPRVPPVLDRIVSRAIAKDPEGRFASAGALAEDLESWLGNRTPRNTPIDWPLRSRLFLRRIARPAAALVGVALVVAGLAWWLGPEPADPTLVDYIAYRRGEGEVILGKDDRVYVNDLLGARFIGGGKRRAIYGVLLYQDALGREWVRPERVAVDQQLPAGQAYGNWLEPEIETNVLVTKAGEGHVQLGLMLFVCDANEEVVERWMDVLAREGPMLRRDSEEMFNDFFLRARDEGSIDPEDLKGVKWEPSGKTGQEVARGVVRWEVLYPVES